MAVARVAMRNPGSACRSGRDQALRRAGTRDGDAARQKYVWKEYENYSHDYDYTYYEQGHGNTPNSSVLNQKTGTANQSGYYTCIYEFFADASGRVVDATARGECR